MEGRGGEGEGWRVEEGIEGEGKVGYIHVLNKLCHLCV